MKVFWRQGYAATSVRDLGNALDLRPGSIYASFRSKENLYIEALRLYKDDHGALLRTSFQAEPTFMKGFERFLRHVIRAGDNPCTCMLGKTLANVDTKNQLIRREAARLMTSVHTFLQREVELAQSQGQLPATCDSAFLAHFMLTQLVGLRSYADAGTARADLERLLTQSMHAIEQCAATTV